MERIEDWPPPERRSALICGCKGTTFPGTDKTLRDFFQKKMHFCHLYIIYYIRARGITEGTGGKRKEEEEEGRRGGRRGCDDIAPYRTEGRGGNKRGTALLPTRHALIVNEARSYWKHGMVCLPMGLRAVDNMFICFRWRSGEKSIIGVRGIRPFFG